MFSHYQRVVDFSLGNQQNTPKTCEALRAFAPHALEDRPAVVFLGWHPRTHGAHYGPLDILERSRCILKKMGK